MELPYKIKKEIEEYCKLNNIEDVNKFYFKLLKMGFDLLKWGDLNDNKPKPIKKEITEKQPQVIENYQTVTTNQPEPIKPIKSREKSNVTVPLHKLFGKKDDIYGE